MFRHVTTRLSGLIILLAGIWGGLIPFLGPYFHFTLGPNHAWTWTTGRLWLDVLPAAAAALGGLILMGGGPRLSGRFGALLALAGGIWFAVGPDISRLWNHGITQQGATHGRHVITRVLEVVTLHTGLGVLIAAFAAYALPGMAAYAVGRRRVEGDAAIAGTGAAAGAAEARHRDRVATREGAGAGAAGVGTGAAGVGTGAAGVGTGAAGTAAAEPATARHADGGAASAADEPTAVQNRNTVGRPVGQDTAADPTGQDTAADPAGQNTAADPAGQNTIAQPADQSAVAEPTDRHTMTQRRGGLARLFSRR